MSNNPLQNALEGHTDAYWRLQKDLAECVHAAYLRHLGYQATLDDLALHGKIVSSQRWELGLSELSFMVTTEMYCWDDCPVLLVTELGMDVDWKRGIARPQTIKYLYLGDN